MAELFRSGFLDRMDTGLFLNSTTIICAACLLLCSNHSYASSFVIEGSDLLMGIGPGDIARGGASSAATNDIYALRWNPAGLAELKTQTFAISRQLDAELDDVNFIGIALHQHNFLQSNFTTTVALGWISRLHLSSNGTFSQDSLEAVFMEYALPGYPDDFNGAIKSKTREYRLGWSIKPLGNTNWGIGFTAGLIHCGTNSCGVRASAPDNYIVSSTDADAVSFGIGAKYKFTDNIRLAASIKDIKTRLHVSTIITDDNGTVKNAFTTHFPTDITLGTLFILPNRYEASFDYQTTFGKYGSSGINFHLLRSGLRKSWNSFQFNVGGIIPLNLTTESTSNLMHRAPSPILPTTGLSWSILHLTFDFAVYPNPVLSYQKDKIILSSEASVALNF